MVTAICNCILLWYAWQKCMQAPKCVILLTWRHCSVYTKGCWSSAIVDHDCETSRDNRSVLRNTGKYSQTSKLECSKTQTHFSWNLVQTHWNFKQSFTKLNGSWTETCSLEEKLAADEHFLIVDEFFLKIIIVKMWRLRAAVCTHFCSTSKKSDCLCRFLLWCTLSDALFTAWLCLCSHWLKHSLTIYWVVLLLCL